MDYFTCKNNHLIVTTVSDEDEMIMNSAQKQQMNENSFLDASFSSPQLPVYQHRSRSPSSMEICSKTAPWINCCHDVTLSKQISFQKSKSYPCMSQDTIQHSENNNLSSNIQGIDFHLELKDSNIALDLISNIDQLTTIGHFGLIRSMSLQSLTTLVNEFKRVSIFSAESAGTKLINDNLNGGALSFIKSNSCPHLYFPLTKTMKFEYANHGLGYNYMNGSLSEFHHDEELFNENIKPHFILQSHCKVLSLSKTLNDSLKQKPSCRNPKLCEQKRLRENASTGCLFNSQEKCLRWLHSIGSLDNQ